MIEVCVDHLGKCEHEDCKDIFYIDPADDRTLHQIVGKVKCELCGRPLTLGSLGRECVGVGGVHYKMRWIGPKGEWVREKPDESFFIKEKGWWVVPGVSITQRGLSLPEGAERQYVVWCQRWNMGQVSGEILPLGYSLHRTRSQLRSFVYDTQCDDKDMKPVGKPYECLVPGFKFRQISTPPEACGMLYPAPLDSPPQYDRHRLGTNVVQIIVAA